jgi:hypothetical protein
MNFTHATTPLHAIHGVKRHGAQNGIQSEQVSVAAVVLLSALAVTMTIFGVMLLGAVMVAAYWLISHIPIPKIVWHVLVLARAIF